MWKSKSENQLNSLYIEIKLKTIIRNSHMRLLNNRLASALLCFVYQNKITAEGDTDREKKR